MALQPIDKSWSSNKKDIKYVNRDFASLKQALVEFTKTYFANTNSDFTDASPGMMFIEQAAYVGDVLSYYTDAQLKESFINAASNYKNILSHAQNFGYVPKISRPATTTLTVYQQVPSINVAGNYEPDFTYCVKIKEGMQVKSKSNNNITFTTTDVVDFGNSINRTVSVLSFDQSNNPNFYLLTKTVPAISATLVTETFPLGSFTPNPTFNIVDSNFIKVVSISDNSNNYYEVPYLAQEMVYIKEPNAALYDSTLVSDSDVTPYNLKLIKTNRRFTTRVTDVDTIQLRFGAASETTADEMIIPNTKNVGLGLNNSISRLEQSFDPSNFLKTSTYGIAPSGTNNQLTVKYYSGGGISSNVASNELRTISLLEFDEDLLAFNTITSPTYQTAKASIAVDNLVPATGGRGIETLDEIRENAIANFASQNRAVTKQDYEVRALSMDAAFGSIAKVYVEQDSAADINPTQNVLRDPQSRSEFLNMTKSLVGKSDTEIQTAIDSFLKSKHTFNADNNPFAINMYTLGYNSNGNLTTLNSATKNNLKTYLNDYRLITDAVNILDGFIINIGVEFEITVYSNYNKREVVLSCLQSVTNYFNINNRKINQPINISELELEIANVDGVASVPKVNITNICGDGTDSSYSKYVYDITAATKNKIVYPSLDPSIFELKFPSTDIKGRAL
jgi:hypothetical protein